MEPIAFDASCLVTKRPTGVERSFLLTLDAFTRMPDAPPCIVFRPRSSRVDLPPRVLAREIPALPLRLWRSTVLPKQLYESGATALLSPIAALPRMAPCPRIATVHELAARRVGAGEHAFEELRHDRAIEELESRAELVLVPSQHTERDLLRRVPALASRVRRFTQPLHPYFLEQYPIVPFAARRGLLFVGKARRRKNLPRILAAWQGMSPELRRENPLYWVGGSIDAGGRTDLPEDVRLLPVLEQTELVQRISMVRGVLLPSLSEGFGLPALEALALGTPVLGSRESPTEEICEGLATLVDPYDVDAIRDAMTRLLEDPRICDSLDRAGPALARRFTPDRSAGAWLEALSELGALR